MKIKCYTMIDTNSYEFMVIPFIHEKLAQIIEKYKCKEFNVKWDLYELGKLDLYIEVDKCVDKDGMYFHNGVQYSFEELRDYFTKYLRKLLIEVDVLDQHEDKGE